MALSSGTSGGVLAPLLIMGGALGSLEAVHPVRRSGFLGAAGHGRHPGRHHALAPDGDLLRGRADRQHPYSVAGLVATVSAFTLTVLLMKRSILTERIARRGLHLSREYSVIRFSTAGSPTS